MEETIAEYLASYVQSIKYEDIPEEVVHKAKILLIDTLGCAIGGYNSSPARIARTLAGQIHQCDMPAAILGSGLKSNLELATFANGVAVRYLDFNDAFFAKEGGHPSDHFAPILTCGDAVHASGKDLLVASILAYEVFCRLSDRIEFSSRGFDHAITGVISAVIGVGKILGLDQDQLIQAINLAVVANISLGQTRLGDVSLWKGCALANAGRNAVFAALMAKEGMTGPGPIFEGRSGFFKAVSGPFQLDEFGGHGRNYRIMDVMVKRYPCGTFAQTAIEAALNLRSQISGIDDITRIKIGTFAKGKHAMGGDSEKWHPNTRESADHSIPYMIGVSLLYGPPEIKHFNPEYLSDPALFSLIQKIEVEETAESNGLYPEDTANRVEITLASGLQISELVKFHHGHPRNPLNNEGIEQKFLSLSDGILPASQSHDLFSTIWDLEAVTDISRIMELLII